MTPDLETKALEDSILKKLKEIFSADNLREAVRHMVRRAYNKGITDVETEYDTSVNIVPNQDAIDFLSKYTFDNVKNMNDELAAKLRKELMIGLMNQENTKQLSERVHNVMEVSRVRANAIARTESHRAYNAGSMHAIKQSGLKVKKQWYNPDPKSDICKHLVTVSPIPLDQAFHFDGQSFMQPPAHVNCRSRLLYIQDGDDDASQQ